MALGLWILKVVVTVLISYRDYMPPNFDNEFLLGRESYFFHGYNIPFFVHVVAGPISLVMGLFLVTKQSRKWRWHRLTGRLQVANVLVLVAPSGLWMAFYAPGDTAAVGFGSLAVATWLFTFFGFRWALNRDFDRHRLWMLRAFALLCSAVLIRAIGGLAMVMNLTQDWVYPFSAWACWLLPLAILEIFLRVKARGFINHP